MTFLIVSVVLNSLLSVIFRYFKEWNINNFAAIVVNYVVCFIIGIIMSGGEVLRLGDIDSSWVPYLITLGTIFIVTFNVIAATVQIFGITIATLTQKMSVLLVVIFSIGYYQEQLNLYRSLGLLAGFISIFLITGKPAKRKVSPTSRYLILLPIIVFFLGGVIDSIFVHISRLEITNGAEDQFAAFLFGFAGFLGLFYLLFKMIVQKQRYTWRDVGAGILLGVPNFFTVYFIQKMLTTDMDGSVIFPIHNIGILLLSALISRMLFGEEFRILKYVGIVLATIAIILLAIGS